MLADFVGAGVGSGDDDGVAEADLAVFFVAEDAFVEDLEQGGEDAGVGFFDFVEEDDRERLFHDLGSEAEFVGSAVFNKTRDVGGGNKFVHVEADDVVFAIEVNFGKGLGELGFADTGGAEEEESADGATLIFDAGAGATESVGDASDGFLLVDHALVDEMFEV